jgi:hypothetical protein
VLPVGWRQRRNEQTDRQKEPGSLKQLKSWKSGSYLESLFPKAMLHTQALEGRGEDFIGGRGGKGRHLDEADLEM